MTPFLWTAVILMLFGVGMILADVGAELVWVAMVAVGAAMVVVDRRKGLARPQR